MTETKIQTPQSRLSQMLFSDKRAAWLWLAVRLYVGWQWLHAGWEKVNNPIWVGPRAGAAVQGFLAGALKKTAGAHPDVQGWYADFLNGFAMQHTAFFSYLVSYGELAVGIALILGIFTYVAAFFGAFMNFNYLFAGTISSNPQLLLLEMFLLAAWRAAGWIGIDRYLLPAISSRWRNKNLFEK